MTAPRAGGSTGRGLRWPGNDITVDQIPDAIQDLAEDIDRNLGSAGNVTIQALTTSVRLPSSGSTPSGLITFVNLAAVVGCVANYAQDGLSAGLLLQLTGNSVTVKGMLTSGLVVNPPSIAPNTGAPKGTYNPQYLVNRDVVVSFIAWGPKA